jgi:hypothetical protein
MNDASATQPGMTISPDQADRDHTLLVSSRLVMGANTTLQLTLLFTYLYLRANNFGGMWHPGGVSAPPEVLALVALAVPVVGALALWAVANAVSKGTTGTISGLLGLAVLAVVLTGAVRIFLMYQFGWDVQNGTYIDISTVWYAVLLAEFIAVGLWLISLVMGHIRGTAPLTASRARAVLEQWTYITGVAVAAYLLIEFVT